MASKKKATAKKAAAKAKGGARAAAGKAKAKGPTAAGKTKGKGKAAKAAGAVGNVSSVTTGGGNNKRESAKIARMALKDGSAVVKGRGAKMRMDVSNSRGRINTFPLKAGKGGRMVIAGNDAG